VTTLASLCKSQFNESEAGKEIKILKNKCTCIICNSLAPHFEKSLINEIGNQPFRLLIDESTDISVLKFLGISITYFNQDKGKIVSTYLSLVQLEAGDADAITHVVLTTLKKKNFNVKLWLV
jgi:hypothetical protein